MLLTIREQVIAATTPANGLSLHALDLAWVLIAELAHNAGATPPRREFDACAEDFGVEIEKAAPDKDSDTATCPDCNGSGEGLSDETTCQRCGGIGELNADDA